MVDLRAYFCKETVYLLVGSFLGALLLYINVYSPSVVEANEQRSKLSAEQAMKAVEIDSDALMATRGRMNELQTIIRQHARKLPDQERLEEVVAFIYTTADQSNLRIERMSQGGQWERDAEYVAIPFQIDFRSDYGSLIAFLTRIENAGRRIFVVDDIVITLDGDANSRPVRLTGRIDVRTFYRGQ